MIVRSDQNLLLFHSILGSRCHQSKVFFSYEKELQAEIGEKKTSYRHYKDVEKELLFMLVKEKGMCVRVAAFELNINARTTECWVAKGRKGPIRLYSKISR